VIIDTSALIAILWDEPDAVLYTDAIEREPNRRMSAGTLLEALIVIDRKGGPVTRGLLDELLRSAEGDVVPVTIEQALIGENAHQSFGKGRHPARLTYGDCFAYALAKQTGEPLLFKGNDFSQTDLRSALDAN